MLLADFLASAVPILPFVFVPIPQARIISVQCARPPGRARHRTRQNCKTKHREDGPETVSIGIAAALAGVIIGVLIDRGFKH